MRARPAERRSELLNTSKSSGRVAILRHAFSSSCRCRRSDRGVFVEMIIMAALGEQRTSDYTITVDSARMTNVGLYVFVGTQSPGALCGTTQALTQPADIARLQRIDGAVHFVDVPTLRECP